ncbi:MAG: hypothetical protein EOO29_07300 [Comamonadaceae bacterium]|nr:MAG: hypothetical protein EOO29_07300 [Comamonadaceae bacterium]
MPGAAADAGPSSIPASDCTRAASPACLQSFEPTASGGALRYYASLSPTIDAGSGPAHALVALHGHPRDANKTFAATLHAAQGGGALAHTLVVAPVFQVGIERAARCSTQGVPAAQPGELLWTCSSWIEGGRASNGSRPTSFAAMDALVAELARQWPSLRTITVAGFSAGGQFVQHYIGFAADRPANSVLLRYVVADPGSWLYFDHVLAVPANAAACPALKRWKYGTDDLPASLGRSAAQARARYAAANVHYLAGELDSSDAKGTAYGALDKSCAAQAQGPFRLQRGLAYAAYDRRLLAPGKQRELTVVPGCAHDVACVFPSPAARAALLGTLR